MLERDSQAVTLRDLYLAQHWDPGTAHHLLAGDTGTPQRYTLPAWRIDEQGDANAMRAKAYGKFFPPGQVPVAPPNIRREPYTARLQITRAAAEGDNHSYYLGEGVYETNYTFASGDYNIVKEMAKNDESSRESLKNLANFMSPHKKAEQNRVYLVMPANIAAMNRNAEREHCADFIRAYDLTLGAMQAALQQVAAYDPGYHNSPLLARQALENELRRLLPLQLQGAIGNPQLLEQKYLAACARSKHRDSQNWHSWGLEKIEDDFVPVAVSYLTGGAREEGSRVYLRYTVGQAQVGVHSTAHLITL